MSTFFKQFPTVDLKYANDDKNTIAYTDIYRFVDVDELNLESFTNYEWYEIGDGERPDHVSQKLYETPNFYWTFFIINERLKGGYKEWPLSNSALDSFIKNKYDSYGLCTIVPFFFSPNVDLMTGQVKIDFMGNFRRNIDLMLNYDRPIPFLNFLNGLNLSYPWLRVKRSQSNLSKIDQYNISKENYQNHWAEIEKFDDSRYQLWLKNVTDSFFFDNIDPNDLGNSSQIEFALYNPYPIESLEYVELEKEHDAWVESAKVWYNTFYTEYTLETGFREELFSKLKFTVLNFYEIGSIAPDYFINGATGEKLCNLFCNITGEGVPIPNYESERTKNEEKRFIRVIRPSLIRRFADTYEKVLKSSGRLQL